MKFFTRKTRNIGLALSSGGARGLAHIGVIKALQEESIPVNMVSGTSMGALVGACFAKDGNVDAIEKLARMVNLRFLSEFLDPSFRMLRRGVIQGGKIDKLLYSLLGNTQFKDLKIPLAIVTVDINTGREVVFRKGIVREAVRASIAIPAIFTPLLSEGKCLVDGGLISPLPVNIIREMGAKVIIGVNVLAEPHKMQSHGIFRDTGADAPNIFEALLRSIYIMEYEIMKLNMQKADIVINPDVRAIRAFEFFKAKEAIKAGYKAAGDGMPKLKRLLGKR